MQTNLEFISLGPNCHTASILKQLKYKTCSFPFDWMLSNINIVTSCIENDFNDFNNRNNYIQTNYNIISLKQTTVKYLDNTFVHKNPIKNKDDFDYYLRCVERFKNLKTNNKVNIFVHTCYENMCLTLEFKSDIILLMNVLNQKYNNYYLLILNYVKVQNIDEPNSYNYIIDDKLITINIYLMYDSEIWYSIDKSIQNFFVMFNPIKEIFNKI